MDWKDSRLNKRLALKPENVERVYEILSEIDGIKNSWTLSTQLMPQTIERLTHWVVVTSTGASNRIEGNQLSDDQIEALYQDLRIKKFTSRDEQEVAGYLEMLEHVFQNYTHIPVSESSILHLHAEMLRHSEKDARHKGGYKFGSNRVEAKDQSGNVVGLIFDPTPPHLVKKEMQELIAWYTWATKARGKHPLILIANFIFEYLAVHPFQDGNGRTSRLLTNLMLLQHDYLFSSLVSHEKIIEAHKADYYLALNKTQKHWKTSNEDISPWLFFFLSVVQEQAKGALEILQADWSEELLSENQLNLWTWAQTVPSGYFSRKDAILALNLPPRTVEESIKKLLLMKKFERVGEGRATRYRLLRR